MQRDYFLDYIQAVKLFSVLSSVSLRTEPLFKSQSLDAVSNYSVMLKFIRDCVILFCNIYNANKGLNDILLNETEYDVKNYTGPRERRRSLTSFKTPSRGLSAKLWLISGYKPVFFSCRYSSKSSIHRGICFAYSCISSVQF